MSNKHMSLQCSHLINNDQQEHHHVRETTVQQGSYIPLLGV